MLGFMEFSEEKKITVKTKMGGEIPATIKVTGKDYHIVKTDSGKQYRVDHQGNSLEENIEDKDLPFTPDKPKKPVAKAGKHGAAYSTVRHLARQAMKKQAEKLKKEEGGKISVTEEEQIDERNQANAMKRKTMDAARGARYKLDNPVPERGPEHKTAQAQNKAIGRALRREKIEEELDENVKKMTTDQLQKQWDQHKDQERPSPVFAAHLKRVAAELKARKALKK